MPVAAVRYSGAAGAVMFTRLMLPQARVPAQLHDSRGEVRPNLSRP
jgi:hypothetical protein